ncbi:flagellar biosynthesis protein FlhA [Flavisphingomonas formosensis]|uniref:flagellar biosynthesis protein FlhA n=1 Tax=Flavisphingomonas formosensis TaxID=861534 RepID=UPI001E3576C9|nr:flagellar biosynthesis protein FlhA [Sphingomonas formosensis]
MCGVIAILLILFSPIPPALLDLLIIVNFAFGLTILLLTFYVVRPVAFSTFPSLLLVATLFRLSLNVAATRLILTGANAGEVIGAIGSFAVQGNFVIGLVVFFILVVVQYVVVTSGAQRVSEVAARFVLDSVPGQQMSIDADLNMGLIDQNEAKRRRKDLEKEAAFYGAMDGASKFVKGDAIAGIIILLIDIIAGWIVGVAQMGMDWSAALQTFTLLTIGDGIVTQVPALVISVATGIIVTRSSADRQLSTEVFSQLTSVPKIPLIVLAALLLLLAMPGMPKWPIILIAMLATASFFAVRRRQRAEEDGQGLFEAAADAAESQAGAPVLPVEVRLGKELGQQWVAIKPLLSERIATLRSQQEQLSGFAFPSVVFQDGSGLKPLHYEIALFGVRHGQGELHPDQMLAIQPAEGNRRALPGVETRDPAFGLPAAWIEESHYEQARSDGYTLIDPVTVLMTHLGETLRREAAMLLTRADVLALLEGVRARQPGLIEELVPAIMTVSDVQRVLQNLLAEEVSIRNMDLITETLVDCGRAAKDPAELTELVRQRLSYSICDTLRGNHDQLAVLSLDPRTEGQIAESLRRSEGAGFLLDPRLADQLIRKLIPMVETMIRQSLAPVLLCSPEIRRHLKTFTRRSVPRLAILSVSEVPHTVDLASFSVLKID